MGTRGQQLDGTMLFDRPQTFGLSANNPLGQEKIEEKIIRFTETQQRYDFEERKFFGALPQSLRLNDSCVRKGLNHA